MTTYATRLSSVFGAGVEHVRRWSQGSAHEEQPHIPSPPSTADRSPIGEEDDEESMSDEITSFNPSHSPQLIRHQPRIRSLHTVPELFPADENLGERVASGNASAASA